MAKNLKKLLSAVLAFAMVAGLAMPAFAETILQGNDAKLNITEGKDPYVYAIAQDPANNRWYYETSNHTLKKEVTGGGADCAEFDPESLESKKMRGLYACGEVLDVDGPCGGFNLQWAWSYGLAAGIAAGKAEQRSC